MQGNPNPSPETRFKPGKSGNPGGKTAKQRQHEVEAAEMAAALRHKMLEELTELAKGGVPITPEMLSSDTLRLFKDSEDRAFGAPKQQTELTGADGGSIVTEVKYTVLDPIKREG